MPRGGERGSDAGFTLLEILVALLILALVFGAVAQITQSGLRQLAAARARTAATLLAQSELARVGVVPPLQPGAEEGQAEPGLLWRSEIELVGGPETHLGLVLYRVRVTVTWGPRPGDQLTLTTLRTGAPPA